MRGYNSSSKYHDKTPTGPDDIITFGQHRGTTVRDLPDNYLNWFIASKRKELDFWSGELTRREAEKREKERQRQQRVEEERRRQEEEARNRRTYTGFHGTGGVNDPTMEEIIQAGYREMAKKYHPDHGGNTQKMQDINAAYENLKGKTRR